MTMLKVLHIPYTYYPDPVGGTEIYVEQLAHALRARQVDSLIVAPGSTRAVYEHRGICVERLTVEQTIHDVAELYGRGNAAAAQEFGSLLDRHKPALVHQHAHTRIVSARLIREAHARGIPVVFTYHTPTVSCQRSGLMRWGRKECDGVLDAVRCTSCRLHSLGLSIHSASILARLPPAIRAWSKPHQGGIWTAIRLRDLIAEQHDEIRDLLANVDAIVALCEWTRQVLLHNQVPGEKIALVPHGFTPEGQVECEVTHNPLHPTALRVVTLGRLEPVKGIDTLVRALARLPSVPIALDIYGIVQQDADSHFASGLRASIARDRRIRLLPPVPHTQVVSLIRQYDLLAAPSQWLETGPLVVLEAFAAGTPVLGSNLGGIAEKVTNGVNGLLVPPLDIQAWSDALERLGRERELLEQLRANISPPRPMAHVAQEMTALYEAVLEKAKL